MAPKAKAQPRAKAPPGAARRVRGKVKARNEKVVKCQRRRAAIAMLNALATEVELGVAPLTVKETRPAVVTRLIRQLESRCQADGLPQRLRAVVEQWKNNGGGLTRDVLAPPEGDDGNATAEETGDAEVEKVGALPMHRVLDPSFRLQSKAFMMTFNDSEFTANTWAAFREHVKSLRQVLKARAWAANWEESTEAADGTGRARFHGHGYLMWSDQVGVSRRNTDDLVFKFAGREVRPRIDACSVRNPATFRMSACRGLWYVSILKKGTRRSATNYPPWRQYSPKAAWLDDLWAAHKLTNQQYLAFSRHFGHGHSSRRRDALDALRDEREEAVQVHVQSEAKLLAQSGSLRAPREFPEIQAFVKLFEGAAKFRRPMFAIVGGTNLGKSLLAAEVLRQVARVLGVGPGRAGAQPDADGDAEQPFLEVTVEDSADLDLSDFDIRAHAGVLLDGVGDAQFLRKHREVLQGRPKVCKGGRSGTMIYAYPFSLCRRAVVATFDLSAANLTMLKTHHWLSDPRNVVQLHLTEPAWQGGDDGGNAPTRTARDKMAAWTADALADFLVERDLAGPAQVLRAAGVDGSDFLEWGSAAALEADLRVAPFTATKLLAVRRAFLEA